MPRAKKPVIEPPTVGPEPPEPIAVRHRPEAPSDDALTLHALADACARMFRCEGNHDATGYTEARRRVREILARIPRPQ